MKFCRSPHAYVYMYMYVHEKLYSITKRVNNHIQLFVVFWCDTPCYKIHGNSKLIIRFANNMLQAHCARHIEDYIPIYR